MENMYQEVARFECRWLSGPPGDVLTRIKALADRNGCWVQLWQNPSTAMEPGWLFWLETHAVGANERMQAFCKDRESDREVDKWLKSTLEQMS